MPVKITAYACEFRCGRIATKPQALYEHERLCFKNPDRRCCKTCRHNERVPYEPDTGDGGYFACTINKLPEGATIALQCSFWEAAKS